MKSNKFKCWKAFTESHSALIQCQNIHRRESYKYIGPAVVNGAMCLYTLVCDRQPEGNRALMGIMQMKPAVCCIGRLHITLL